MRGSIWADENEKRGEKIRVCARNPCPCAGTAMRARETQRSNQLAPRHLALGLLPSGLTGPTNVKRDGVLYGPAIRRPSGPSIHVTETSRFPFRPLRSRGHFCSVLPLPSLPCGGVYGMGLGEPHDRVRGPWRSWLAWPRAIIVRGWLFPLPSPFPRVFSGGLAQLPLQRFPASEGHSVHAGCRNGRVGCACAGICAPLPVMVLRSKEQ